MTNTEKWLTEQGFELIKKEIKQLTGIGTMTVIIYHARIDGSLLFEACICLFDPADRVSNFCQIKTLDNFSVTRLQWGSNDKYDTRSGIEDRAKRISERMGKVASLLHKWDKEMSEIENPFSEYKEELE